MPLAVGTDIPLLRRIGPGLFWVVVMLFGVLISVRRTSAETPAQRDVLALLGADAGAVFTGRVISTTAMLLAFELVIGVVAVLLYDIRLDGWQWLLVLVPLARARSWPVGVDCRSDHYQPRGQRGTRALAGRAARGAAATCGDRGCGCHTDRRQYSSVDTADGRRRPRAGDSRRVDRKAATGDPMTLETRSRVSPRFHDRLAVGSLLIALGFALFSPKDVVQGDLTRMLYIHVPSIVTAYAAFVLATVTTIGYLVTRSLRWDRWAGASAEVGVVFLGLAIATGMIWGKPVWGVWWTWDARLTSTALMFFIYLGYLGLRRSIADPESRARRSAILGIVAVVQIPIVHFSVLWWNTLHQAPTIPAPRRAAD